MSDLDLFGDPLAAKATTGLLAARFGGMAPFSVLNAREGYWQDRKREWLALGIESEIGRGENLLGMSETVLAGGFDKNGASKVATYSPEANAHLSEQQRKSLGFYRAGFGADVGAVGTGNGGSTGTSIFDPFLCELAYRWWCPPGGLVLDPFAGGSVRGIVAGALGRRYYGVDLREEQVRANEEQRDRILRGDQALAVNWRCGDSAKVARACPMADFLFSCPPYGDLEVYSDTPEDLSVIASRDFDRFVLAYRAIIDAMSARLNQDRFACFVVGDFRDSKGIYRDFVSVTIAAFRSAGLRYYNEGVLVTSVGSLPMRMAGQFNGGRKLGKTHQNVLVFVKGDWEKAGSLCEQMKEEQCLPK